MIYPNYPKIDTLFNRNPKTFKVIEGPFRCVEFGNIRRWLITEKIDGTNILVLYDNLENNTFNLSFGGRTAKSQLPDFLSNYLKQLFTLDNLKNCFAETTNNNKVCIKLYGEGYGHKIQGCGKHYNPTVSFRLFDVKINQWWLNWENIVDVAHKLNVKTVPIIWEEAEIETAIGYVKHSATSKVAFEEGKPINNNEFLRIEGIVARTNPLLLKRDGSRLMWKLKTKDFS